MTSSPLYLCLVAVRAGLCLSPSAEIAGACSVVCTHRADPCVCATVRAGQSQGRLFKPVFKPVAVSVFAAWVIDVPASAVSVYCSIAMFAVVKFVPTVDRQVAVD